MADYIYLLEHRLSADQQKALQGVRDVARAQGLTVFLVGGAVRDLTSGSPVRDLDVVVQGNALLLRDAIKAAGGVVTGELKAAQSLFARFTGSVRVEIGSTLSVSYPKPGKPVMEPATILDDLRRRDFTVNAMALSLNEGSYGLLMDPMNGVADIENRQLRLVSNYGFIEDPVRMIRAARFSARLGWTMDEKTQGRYETGKQENYIKVLGDAARGYETEEIFHEEDPLRILRKLEEEGWMKHLFPALTVAKANAAELDKLREVQTQLQLRGIHPEAASANFPLLTAKMAAADVAELKRSFVRPGFVAEIDSLEGEAKEFASLLAGKAAALPSQAWKLLIGAKPEAVLWVAYSTKNAGIQAKLKSFYTEWPKARQKVPYALMQEMRIVPELEGFNEIVDKLFYELMDGKLETVEEMKAFLETYSPPAPPPPVRLSRARAGKKDAKGAKSRKKLSAEAEDEAGAEALPVPSDDDESEIDEDEVETEEEATEVVPLRASPPIQVPSALEPPPPPQMTLPAEMPPDPPEPIEEKTTPVSETQPAEIVLPAPPAAPLPAVPEAPAVVASAPKKTVPSAAVKRTASVAAKKEVSAIETAPAEKPSIPAKKVAGEPKPAAKTPAKKAVKTVAERSVPVLKAVPAAKAAAPAKKTASTAASPIKMASVKSVPAKKTTPAKGAAPAKKAAKFALGRRNDGDHVDRR